VSAGRIVRAPLRRVRAGAVRLRTRDWPPLSTFRSDIGLGLDFAGIGVYAAKSVSTPAEPINFFVRLRHRF